jgi:hypothetical protein
MCLGASVRSKPVISQPCITNADRELTALVIYPVDCGAEQCALRHPVAFAVFAAGGQIVKFHADPGQETLLSKLLSFQVT